MSCELVVPANQEMLKSERIPITLMHRFLNRGHRLFMDNYYTSPNLVKFLLEHETKVVGTVRSNCRNFPPELAAACTLQRGESKFAPSDNGIVAVKFRALQDKSNKQGKVVFLLSSDYGNDVVSSGKQTKDGEVVMKPTCVSDYNKNMGGVDMMELQLESLLVIRKAYKWYKKLIFHLLMQSFPSAHKLYQLNGSQNDFLKYLHNVVTQLLTYSQRLSATAKSLDGIARLTGRTHFPLYVER